MTFSVTESIKCTIEERRLLRNWLPTLSIGWLWLTLFVLQAYNL